MLFHILFDSYHYISCLAWPWMILYWNVKEYVLGLRQLVPFPMTGGNFTNLLPLGTSPYITHHYMWFLTSWLESTRRVRRGTTGHRHDDKAVCALAHCSTCIPLPKPRNVVAPVWHLKECAGEWHSNQWWRQVLVYLHSRRTLKLPGKDYQTECFATRVWWTTYVRKELLHSSKFFVIPF